jgi:hypothetical protein
MRRFFLKASDRQSRKTTEREAARPRNLMPGMAGARGYFCWLAVTASDAAALGA